MCGICVDECPSQAIKKDSVGDDLDRIDVSHLAACQDIWVVAEVRNKTLAGCSFELLGEATRLTKGKKHKVAAVLLCDDAKDFP